MKFHRSFNLLALLLAVALASGPVLRAQETPPAPSTAPADKNAAETKVAPESAKPADSSVTADDRKPADDKKPVGESAVTVTVSAPAEPTPVPEKPAASAAKAGEEEERDSAIADEKAAEEVEKVQKKTDEISDTILEKARAKAERAARRERHQGFHGSDRDQVRVMDDNHVASDVVVPGSAVAILGDLTIDGEVLHDAVNVVGDSRVNGTVHGNLVTVMGDAHLGPKARIDGDLIVVGGEVQRDEGAQVNGNIEVNPINIKVDSISNWWVKALRVGRPLAIGAHLAWLWIATAIFIAFYALLALAFPNTINKCGEKIVQRPGMTILAAVLSMLALPVLFILLCVTVIGIPVAIFLLPLSVIITLLVGKASVYALIGRRISKDRVPLALSVILGALLFVVLYLLPIVGLLLSFMVSFVGFGCVVLTIFTPAPKPVVVTPVPAMPVAAPLSAGMEASAAVPMAPIVGVPSDAAPVPPLQPAAPIPAGPPLLISASTLPRVGFWPRVAAALLDVILIGILIGMSEGFFHGFGFHPGEGFPLWFAAYNILMWGTKGTTIGGIICGLKVVRLDDRPVDWGVAIVRGLGAFLSLAVCGLGFIWVAFDNDKQSWHDKIAGTTIVRLPKGTPLI